MKTDKEININTLMEQLNAAITKAGAWGVKLALSDDVYHCVWGGQGTDGRKRQVQGAKEPFPWNGASDTRIRLVKGAIRELEALCDSVYRKSRMQYVGIDSLDKVKAHRINQLLRWQLNNQISKNSKRELVLARNYTLRYGLSFLSITWERKERMGLKAIRLQDILAVKEIPEELWFACVQNPEAFIAQIQNVNIPTEEDVLLQECYNLYTMLFSEDESAFAQFFQDEFGMGVRRAKKAVKDFKENEVAEVPEPRIVRDSPTYEAFVPFRNIFFPLDTKDINEASWVAVRKWYTKEEIETNEEFSEEFKAKVLENKGTLSTGVVDNVRSEFHTYKNQKTSAFLQAIDARDNYEIFEFYYKKVEDGIVCIYKAVMSAFAKDDSGYMLGSDELYDEHSEEYPFLSYEFDPDSTCLLDACGLPELIYTYQFEIKNMRDARINAADIAILPPIRRNVRDRATPLSLGPAREVQEQIAGSTQFLPPPENRSAMAIELEEKAKQDADRFSACFNNGVPAGATSLLQSSFASNYLDFMRDVLSATFKLNQLYMPTTLVTRITGMSPEPFEMSKEEIQGSFDVSLSYDTDELDPKHLELKLSALEKIMDRDSNGVIDTNKATSLKLSLIDPNWAEMLITDENNGAKLEREDEQKCLSLIMTGQEPELKEGINPRIRLEYLQSSMKQSPKIAQELATNEFVRALFENRVKHLTFMIQQQENAKIGRVGTSPIMQ